MTVSTLAFSSFFLLLCFLVYPYEAVIPDPDTIWYAQGRRSSLNEPLSGGSGLHCLRLYQESRRNGDWADFCNSNELLPSCFFWQAGSACAPPKQWWQQETHWLLFEGPSFNGRYALLKAGDCKQDLRRMGLQSVGSILICEKSSQGYLNCQVPPRPWRQYNDHRHSSRVSSRRDETTFASLATGTPKLNIEGQLSLDQLQAGQLKD